jgi:hypothetical protein
MLNYQSVRSSEPQIRSNPALRQLGQKSGFQKRVSTLLESTPLPFPTFQLVKEASQTILETQKFYGWIRPSHLRAQWLVLADDMPTLLLDPKHTDRLSSLRVPFDKKKVQQIGPIVCEAAWDAQDHILWIFDVVIWEKQVIWNHVPYSKRWTYVKDVIGKILDCGHPMSDAEVRVPSWLSLNELGELPSLDPAMSIEFQPEKAGQRRQLLLIRDEGIKFKPTSHHERKMVSETLPHRKSAITKFAFVEDEVQLQQPSQPSQPSISVRKESIDSVPSVSSVQLKEEIEQKKIKTVDNHPTICKLMKDKSSRAPDTYILKTVTDESLGLAAIRSLDISKRLRESLKNVEYVMVGILWYEPFQKYEVKQILSV